MQALTVRKLTPDEIAQLRGGNASIDLQLAAVLEGESVVFSAHRSTSTIVVVHDNPGGTEAHLIEGGTEWDRRQAGLNCVARVMRKAEEKGMKCTRL